MSGFDWVAPFYDPLERLTAGSILQRARAAHLDALAQCRAILSAGEGHGRFAAMCAAAIPGARMTCVDASGPMLERARRRVRAEANVEWIAATLPVWKPARGAYDAIVTCFFLDCFGPGSLPAVVEALADGATRDALWINVDFAVPARGFARWRARVCLAVMHAFFRAACGIEARRLEPVAPDLIRHGFKVVDSRQFSLGLAASTVWRRD